MKPINYIKTLYKDIKACGFDIKLIKERRKARIYKNKKILQILSDIIPQQLKFKEEFKNNEIIELFSEIYLRTALSHIDFIRSISLPSKHTSKGTQAVFNPDMPDSLASVQLNGETI